MLTRMVQMIENGQPIKTCNIMQRSTVCMYSCVQLHVDNPHWNLALKLCNFYARSNSRLLYI